MQDTIENNNTLVKKSLQYSVALLAGALCAHVANQADQSNELESMMVQL